MKKVILGFFELCVHIVAYAFVILVVYRAALFTYDYSYNVFGDPVVSKYDTEKVSVVVNEGDSVSDIARTLKKNDLIKYETAFTIRVRLEEAGENMTYGVFELSPSMSVEEIIHALVTEGEKKQTEEQGVIR